MSNRVYVGNLAWSVSWQDLKDHMRDAGDVQYSKVLTDRDGRSKGCGIVEFSTVEGAKDAIEKLTDTELKGRKIFVREDREDGKRGGGGGGGANNNNRAPPQDKKDPTPAEGASGDKAAPAAAESTPASASSDKVEGSQLFIGNLSWDTTWQELKDHVGSCGTVEYSNVAIGRDGRKKGFGFVRFATKEEADVAIEKMNGTEFMGRNIEVRLDNKA
jgi:RNA recognition motif-containing protein